MSLNAISDLVTTTKNTSVSGNVFDDNGKGPETGDTLSVLKVNDDAAGIDPQITLPSGAPLTLNADGTFDYDPDGVFAAGTAITDSFTYATGPSPRNCTMWSGSTSRHRPMPLCCRSMKSRKFRRLTAPSRACR
jgi:hypothetical protein